MRLRSYQFLKTLGLSPNWQCNQGKYVVASGKGNTKVSVARVLLDAKPGFEVRFRNNNPLDIRKDNLELVSSRKAIRRDRDLI